MQADAGMTRRGFVRAGATAGAALALGSGLAVGEEPSAAVRVGIVGVGSRGTGLLQTLLTIEGVEVHAVCDIVPARAARAQQIVEERGGNRPEAYTKSETDFENLVQREDLDAVICATPWEWHTPVTVAAMRAGKYGATEVPAATTIEECWELVRTSEETGMPCMMLENVCYFQNVLTILRMVREGVFGDMLHCEAGYQHDCRFLVVKDGPLPWRMQHKIEKNGNLYPTHPIGPVAQWLNINRGDRFAYLTSMSTPSKGLKYYAAKTLGPDHKLANTDYALGDVNTTLIKTANGLTVTLYFDTTTYRPYDLIFRVQGVKGLYLGTLNKVCIEGMTPEPEQWEPFEPYLEKYAHPLWTDLEQEALRTGGHGGADYVTLHQFIKAVRAKAQTPQDVYDAATWSAIFPLSIDSVAKDSQPVAFPDFTNGRWKTNPPIPIHGA